MAQHALALRPAQAYRFAPRRVAGSQRATAERRSARRRHAVGVGAAVERVDRGGREDGRAVLPYCCRGYASGRAEAGGRAEAWGRRRSARRAEPLLSRHARQRRIEATHVVGGLAAIAIAQENVVASLVIDLCADFARYVRFAHEVIRDALADPRSSRRAPAGRRSSLRPDGERVELVPRSNLRDGALLLLARTGGRHG
eukprot:scaffold5688_cov116-Isochrysis_galbana.AAC.12